MNMTVDKSGAHQPKDHFSDSNCKRDSPTTSQTKRQQPTLHRAGGERSTGGRVSLCEEAFAKAEIDDTDTVIEPLGREACGCAHAATYYWLKISFLTRDIRDQGKHLIF